MFDIILLFSLSGDTVFCKDWSFQESGYRSIKNFFLKVTEISAYKNPTSGPLISCPIFLWYILFHYEGTLFHTFVLSMLCRSNNCGCRIQSGSVTRTKDLFLQAFWIRAICGCVVIWETQVIYPACGLEGLEWFFHCFPKVVAIL